MSTDSIDWIFDSSREGTIPKGEGSWWRLIVKCWVLGAIFSCLASIAVVVTAVMRPQSVPVEYVLAGVMGVLILLFCLFLVRMTYRCAIRRRRNRNLDRAANRLTKDEHDFGWCKVTRELGWAEITIPASRWKLSLCLAFHEFGWPFFRVGDKCSPEFLVCDPVAPQYDHGRVVYQEFLDRPCATPLSAAHAAERIFVTLYGEGAVSGRPWRVADTNGCYIVTGSLSEGGLGDVSQLKMQKKDGRVWVYGRRKWQHGNEHLPK